MGFGNQLAIYLGGPINGCTDEQAKGWRSQMVAGLDGVTFFDPMERDYRGIELQNVQELVERDKQLIEQCDYVVANVWKPSTGTAMEIMYAHYIGRPVILIVEDGSQISPWLVYHSSYRVSSVDEAIALLKDRIEEQR